ncbi:hypothetical protein [Parasitella parasitica]|uniref:RING-type domain-containing protein n=1 Tax=Parasitella parasitica TaxID=35722 RepID=A0A0B7N736_9FUNG|nr:hypothetical protein [Parasitella parasitica]
MYESEDSSVASSSSFGEQDEMEHFMNRCSICFDAQLDFCLEHCKDQYCLDCFQKYIVEVVKSSWGLSVTPIRCPVCTELIPKHEWTRYVPGKIIELYDKFNKPYRSYTRACPHCENEMTPCVYTSSKNQLMQPKVFCDIMESMLYSCHKGESHKNHSDHIAVKRWITIYKRQDWSDSRLLNLYKNIMRDVLTFEEAHIIQQPKKFAHNISQEFINNFYLKPEVWKQLQFAHISNFPQMSCTSCHLSICLHCGYDAHKDMSCEDNMKLIVSSKFTANEIKETVEWKLANSRRCPNCSIMINRDEGYHHGQTCTNVTSETAIVSNSSVSTTTNTEEKTEVGVPNMKSIQARLVTHHHQEQHTHRLNLD